MSATAWRPSSHGYWPELLWAGFAAVNLVAVALVPRLVPIPFHFIWISLMLLYGIRAWRLRATLLTLAAVTVASGVALPGVRRALGLGRAALRRARPRRG